MNDQDNKKAAGDITEEAAIMFHNGRYDVALAMFEKALALDPKNVRALGGKSLTLTQLGRAEEALAMAQEAVACDARYAPSYTALAYAYHRLGREAEAESAFRKAIELNPDGLDAGKVLYNFACYWAERGEEEKCQYYLKKAFALVAQHTLDHAPNDPDLARFAQKPWFKELLAEAKLARRRSKTDKN